MNKFAKGCLIVAGALVIIGFIAVGIALSMGAKITDLPNMSIDLGNNGHFGIGKWSFDADTGGGRLTSAGGQEVDRLAEFEPEDVSELNLDFGALNVQLKEGDKYTVSVSEQSKVEVKYKLDNGVLSIYNDGNITFSNTGDEGTTVTITVPKDVELDEFDVDVGAGSFNSKVAFSAKSADISVGVGDMNMSNFTAKDADIECGMGNITLSGKFLGDTHIECGMGNVDVETEGAQADYSCTGEVGMGHLEFGDKKYSGIMDIDYGRRGDNNFDIDLAMGRVAITFN